MFCSKKIEAKNCLIFSVTLTLLFSTIAAESGSEKQTNATSDKSSTNQGNDALKDGLKPLYFLTEQFLVLIQPETGIAGDINVTTFMTVVPQQISSQQWESVLSTVGPYAKRYIGFGVCFVVGIISIILMPLIGLCFCCCRCCGNCGGKTIYQDRKHDKCRRGIYAIILFIITGFMIASTVCAFLTNELLRRETNEDSDSNMFTQMSRSFTNIDRYLTLTSSEIKKSVIDDYKSTSDSIVQQVNNSAIAIQKKVGEQTNAGPLLDKANKLASDYGVLKGYVDGIANESASLKDNGQKLQTSLNQVGTNVKSISCTSNQCNAAKTAAGTLETTKFDFSAIDDVTTVQDNLKKAKNMPDYVKNAYDKYTEISKNISKEIQSYVSEAKKQNDEVIKQLEDGIAQVDDIVNMVKGQISNISSQTNQYKQEVSMVDNYRFYAYLGISCALALMVFLTLVGLLFGVCGERPYDDAGLCNKRVGASFLMAGVAFTFIFFAVLMLVTMSTFLAGGMVETELCRYFTPEGIKEIGNLEQSLKGQVPFLKDFSISNVMQSCSKDMSLYAALDGDKHYNISGFVNQSVDQVLTQLNEAKSTISGMTFGDINIIPDDLKTQMDEFSKAGFDSLNYSQSLDALKKSASDLNNLDLNDIAKIFDDAATASGTSNSDKVTLSTAASTLRKDQTDYVEPMNKSINAMITNFQKLEAQTKDFKNSVQNLITELEAAKENLKNITSIIQSQLDSVFEDIKKKIEDYANTLLWNLHNSIGKCKSLYESMMSLTGIVCKDILQPFNGFWFAVGWFLFFSIFSIIFSTLLVGLYRKTDKWSEKEYDESDSPHYNGMYPGDNIPLDDVQTKPAHYRNGQGLQNGAYEREVSPHADYHYHRAPPDNQPGPPQGGVIPAGHRQDPNTHSRQPPAYSPPTPPNHWQNNRIRPMMY